jgi:hypothetical protein
MVDHMCEPICQSRFASCGSNRALQGGSRVPLTELGRDFIVHGFMVPFVVVRRKSDGAKGSMEFTHSPRFYFNFVLD